MLAGADLDGDAYADRLEARSAVVVEPLPSAAGAPAAWAIESCRIIADTPLYPRRADGREQHVLDDDYVDRLRPIAERRVLQAAFRLAALIEAAVVPAR